MAKLTITGAQESEEAWKEDDPYLPLKVRWPRRYMTRPAHYRIEGKEGGNLDLTVDPESRQLLGFVIIDMPPTTNRAYTLTIEEELVGTPTIDLEPWQPGPDFGIAQYVVRQTEDIVRWMDREAAYICVAGSFPVKLISAGEVDVLAHVDGRFLGVRVRGNTPKQWRAEFEWQ